MAIRVLVAKPGLDGHDKGAKTVALVLKDAGMEVIYSGLHKSIEEIVNIAVQEDVDVIGLSILSGAHIPICEKLTKLLSAKKIKDKIIIAGGVIPEKDKETLKAMGINGVFPTNTPFEEIVKFIKIKVKK